MPVYTGGAYSLESIMDVLTFDIGLAYKLKRAMNGVGWREEDIARLAEGQQLEGLLGVLRGSAIIAPAIIECDALPIQMPQGSSKYSIRKHRKIGTILWDPSKIKFLTKKEILGGDSCSAQPARLLMEKRTRRRFLNATVLEYLLAHPHLIPEDWFGRDPIKFIGTEYEDPEFPSGHIRTLYCGKGKAGTSSGCWDSNYWLGHYFDGTERIPYYAD